MYLFEKDEDSIVKQALLLSINLHSNGNTSFYSNIMELSKSYNLPNFVPNNLDKTKISRYKDIMKQKYITQWRHSVNYTRKLEFYNRGGHWGLRYCGNGQFFLRYFGNSDLKLRYCDILKTCGIRF